MCGGETTRMASSYLAQGKGPRTGLPISALSRGDMGRRGEPRRWSDCSVLGTGPSTVLTRCSPWQGGRRIASPAPVERLTACSCATPNSHRQTEDEVEDGEPPSQRPSCPPALVLPSTSSTAFCCWRHNGYPALGLVTQGRKEIVRSSTLLCAAMDRLMNGRIR